MCDNILVDSSTILPIYVKEVENIIITDNAGRTGEPGLSAYKVAVSNGFIGTEVEWLASLKGAPADISNFKTINNNSIIGTGDISITGFSGNYSDLTNIPQAFVPTSHTHTKVEVGLSNVDNTSDLSKPVSTAAQSALDLKAPLASPTFTGTVSGIDKTMVGLGSVDNTSDLSKPVSTAAQSALDLKANLTSAVLVTPNLGTPSAGILTNCTFPTLNQNTTGTSSNVTGVVLGANGGTGVANTGKTITLGGNLTTTGAFATTLTSTAATSVILPTTGTLATLAGTETLSNKTLVTPNIGVASGTSFNSITALSSTSPAMDGTSKIGTSTTVARADHVHPIDTSRAPLASPTFTGTVTATNFSGNGSSVTNVNATLLNDFTTSTDIIPFTIALRDSNGRISASSFYGVNLAENTVTTNIGTPTIEEMALVHGEMSNKLRFISPSIQEESTDGITWTTSTRVSANDLGDMMIGEGQGASSFPAILPANTTNSWRITWDINALNDYVSLNKFYAYISTNGNTITVMIEEQDASDSLWYIVTSGPIEAWPGHLYIPHTDIDYQPTASTPDKSKAVRVTFNSTNASVDANSVQIGNIEWFGGYPTGRRNVESYDRNKNVTFPANINVNQLISTVGTGTPPLIVSSTTKVPNLNADLLDGLNSTAFQPTLISGSNLKTLNGESLLGSTDMIVVNHQLNQLIGVI